KSMDKGKIIADKEMMTRVGKEKAIANNSVKEMQDSLVHNYYIDDIHYSFLGLVNDLKIRKLINVKSILDKGTRITTKEAMEYWKKSLIDGVQDPKLLLWMATNFLRAQLSIRLGDTAAFDEVVKVMKDPIQSTTRVNTLKVSQSIGVQTVLLGANNSFVLHEDMEQLDFDIGLHLDQL
ncbi:hypothetical protein KI387_023095, partial [Taxus chinensis]